jgi:hypothetical protein
MQPDIVVSRPETLPWDTGGVPVNTAIGGYVFRGGDRPVRKLREKQRRPVNRADNRSNKGW